MADRALELAPPQGTALNVVVTIYPKRATWYEIPCAYCQGTAIEYRPLLFHVEVAP